MYLPVSNSARCVGPSNSLSRFINSFTIYQSILSSSNPQIGEAIDLLSPFFQCRNVHIQINYDQLVNHKLDFVEVEFNVKIN